MKRSSILFALLLMLASPTRAQNINSSAVDSLMQARIAESWSHVNAYYDALGDEAAEEIADPQPGYATEFMTYFREHPDQPIGIEAGVAAFIMWGNLGAADDIEEAVKHVPADSEVWWQVVHSIGNAYARSGRFGDYIELITRLEKEVTHPRGRSELLLTLGGYFRRADQTDKAKALFAEVIELDAHPFDVQKAKGMHYEMTALAVGQPAPDFTARTIDGQSVTLSDLRGKVVLIEFWATYCGPCLPEIPHLKQMHESLSYKGFQIIGITEDEDLESLQSFLREQNMTWPQVQQRSRFENEVLVQDEVLRLYNVYAIPQSFLIDKSGTIAATDLRGENLVETVRKLVDSE